MAERKIARNRATFPPSVGSWVVLVPVLFDSSRRLGLVTLLVLLPIVLKASLDPKTAFILATRLRARSLTSLARCAAVHVYRSKPLRIAYTS